MYNIADTYIVGKISWLKCPCGCGWHIRPHDFSLFDHNRSVHGCGSLVSYCFGERNELCLKGCLNISFLIIGSVTLVTEPITLCFFNEILKLLHTPMKIMLLTSDYVRIILSGVGLCFYTLAKEPLLLLSFKKKSWKDCSFGEVVRMSTVASVQQSVMNFGILMIQGLVNSFGTTVMAAFTVAVHNC